jgi:hypothetical protein
VNRTYALDPSVAALAACLIGVATISLAVPAQAQVLTSGKHLSLSLALDAAQAALQSCEIRDKFKRENGLDYDLTQIGAASGAKHVIYNAFQSTLDAGDEVIIPVP